MAWLRSIGSRETDTEGESYPRRFLRALHRQYRRQQYQFTAGYSPCE